MMIFFILLIEYIILAILCYFIYWEGNLVFYRNGEEIEIKDSEKKVLFTFMSIFWIFYVPKLLIDYFRR